MGIGWKLWPPIEIVQHCTSSPPEKVIKSFLWLKTSEQRNSCLMTKDFVIFNHLAPPLGKTHSDHQPALQISFPEPDSAVLKYLMGLSMCWREIFNNMQPDVVVAQYAPVAQFAARLSDLPCLSLNTGFECPPSRDTFSLLSHRHIRMTRDQLLARELKILNNINRICSRQRHFCCPNLQEVLRSDINLLITLPDSIIISIVKIGTTLDRYRCLITVRRYGGVERNVPRIFVYLRSFPNIGGVLDVLANSGADVIAHIPNIENKISANYTSSSVRITSSMIKLSGLLADMDLAITHAGHGTACATLLAGVPLLMIPTTIEQWLMNRNMEHLGCWYWNKKKEQ